MSNHELIQQLQEIADLMEIQGADPFRINSYRKAARSVEDLADEVAEVAARDELLKLPGIGKGMAEKIREFLDHGRIGLHEELASALPPGILKLLAIPGLGPKKVQALHHELGIGSLEDLQAALAAGTVETLAGFGKKTAAKIAEGLAFLERSAGRVPMGLALAVAETLRDMVRKLAGVRRVEIAGSLRRGRETIGDIDLLCESTTPAETVQAFTKLKPVRKVLGAGDTKASVLVDHPQGGEMQVDLRVVEHDAFGAALQYFTGSKEHNVHVRELAGRRGWKLNEYGLFEGDKRLAGKDEAEIYDRLGLPFFPPEIREDSGEIEAAGELPTLVTLDDIRGDLHLHTTASDGHCSIEEMARAALERGYTYIAVTDHSRSSVIANGLSIERLEEQVEEVAAANRRLKGITVLAGTECDILSDGSLDYPDELLAQLDWVVASVHAAQGQDADRTTGRILDALANPYVSALGHPSGRLLGRRDAMHVHWEKVFEAAARTGTALEVNASWQRLDLKDTHVRRAIAEGCRLVINTDAHDTAQLDQMKLGVITARRGWATAEAVLNTQPLAAVRKFVAAKRKAAG